MDAKFEVPSGDHVFSSHREGRKRFAAAGEEPGPEAKIAGPRDAKKKKKN